MIKSHDHHRLWDFYLFFVKKYQIYVDIFERNCYTHAIN